MKDYSTSNSASNESLPKTSRETFVRGRLKVRVAADHLFYSERETREERRSLRYQLFLSEGGLIPALLPSKDEPKNFPFKEMKSISLVRKKGELMAIKYKMKGIANFLTGSYLIDEFKSQELEKIAALLQERASQYGIPFGEQTAAAAKFDRLISITVDLVTALAATVIAAICLFYLLTDHGPWDILKWMVGIVSFLSTCAAAVAWVGFCRCRQNESGG